MANDKYQVPSMPGGDPGTGPRFDTDEVNDGTHDLQRDKILLAKAGSLEVAGVINTTPAGTEYGLITRNIPSGVQPVSDNAGSLTVDSTQLPASLGQKAISASFPVTLPSDQPALPITDNASSLTVDAPTASPIPSRIGDGTNQSTLVNANLTGAEFRLPTQAFIQGAPQTAASGQITAAQPTPGTPVAGGTVGGATDYSTANNASVTLSGGGGVAGSVLIFEASDNAGTTWFQVAVKDELSGVSVNSVTVPASVNRSYSRSLIGFDRFRVRCTTFVASSTPNVRIDPGTLPFEPVIAAVQSNPPGAQLFSLTPAAAGVSTQNTTEALATLVPQRNLTASATATTHTVTAGKTLRILGFQASFRGVAATATIANIYIRAVLTGTVAVTSPIVAHITLSVPATANSHVFAALASAGYLELPSGASFGVTTVLTTNNTGSLSWPSVVGIEY